MREVISQRLWLGNASDARDIRRVHDLGVAAIVDVALALVRDQSPEDTLQQLIAGNPHDVSPLLWSEVKNAYNKVAD